MIEIQIILDFLNDLDKNNHYDWFHAHKKEYQQARLAFKQLIQKLIDEIATFDPSIFDLKPKDLIFRLNRDRRFSKHLPPYKTAFSAHLSPAGAFRFQLVISFVFNQIIRLLAVVFLLLIFHKRLL